MSDKIFLDSNVLIYCYTSSDPKKQNIARALVSKPNTYISTQVLNETISVLNKKYKIGWALPESMITDFENNFFIYNLSANEIRKACGIAQKYMFSFYDSTIISAALECTCTILYSEDLQHTQKIENNIQIINPFL